MWSLPASITFFESVLTSLGNGLCLSNKQAKSNQTNEKENIWGSENIKKNN